VKRLPQILRSRRLWICSALVCVAFSLLGCRTATFYAQAARGQFQILAGREPIERLLADDATPDKLKQQLRLVLQLREFAATELKLPVDGHYDRYVDLGRPFAVWNVTAAPEFSLQPRTWWYPIVGSLKYRGYFTEAGARAYAATLAGDDVYVEGVRAYSTLGWFKDPVLNTFVNHHEIDLAQLLFHELGHQRLFVSGDTDFNEAFATAVGEEGVRRWLQSGGRTADWEKYQRAFARQEQFVALVQKARKNLKRIYGDPENGTKKSGPKIVPTSTEAAEIRRAKEEAIALLRRDYEALKISWGGYAGYDAWFAKPLNNAQLNTVATYHDLVPAFERLIKESGGDLEKFYASAKAIGKLPKDQRRAKLRELAARAQ
jgi:predicted aminopeptidase